ncbi:tRNA lysidine(34) synthetase TilS [bacterium]|nr:MAG: tRNA lysidine(34) synthetase TilS [bacterium]QQR61959.1 MAG: tRNA lysidine(34) synthetase TilS [bacterium]QQR62449.1 MAG: tRNA lysidine(34) synthetase TilS [bacterium]
MNIFHTIELFCLKNELVVPSKTIIIGLSGGPDSVFLFHFFKSIQKKYQLTLIAAHLNHGWRSIAESDQEFCRSLAKKYDVPFASESLDRYKQDITYNGSKEAFARKARKLFFQAIQSNYKHSLIALAHHADDQLETFFIRLARGTTITGLSCMRPKNGFYIRPLLNAYKADIIAYLLDHNLPFCIDETNDSEAYLRNRIRKNLLKNIESVDSRFKKNSIRTIQSLQATENFLQIYTQNTLSSIQKYQNNLMQTDLHAFLQLHPFMQKRALALLLIDAQYHQELSESLLDEIIRFIKQSKKTLHIIEFIAIKKTDVHFFIENHRRKQ